MKKSDYDTTNRLYEIRMARGISRTDVAAAIDASPHSVYSWEHGKSRPREFQIVRLADYFGVSVDELGLKAYKPRNFSFTPEILPNMTEELAAMLREMDELGHDCTRYVMAYLSPNSEAWQAQKLREGRVTDDEMKLIRECIDNYKRMWWIA